MPQIKHLVLLKFRPQTTRDEIAEIFESLDALQESVPGMLDVSGGPYKSSEGLHHGYTHAFVVTFANADCRDAYLVHPRHEALKQLILAQLDGGLAGVIAFDFEVCDRFRYT